MHTLTHSDIIRDRINTNLYKWHTYRCTWLTYTWTTRCQIDTREFTFTTVSQVNMGWILNHFTTVFWADISFLLVLPGAALTINLRATPDVSSSCHLSNWNVSLFAISYVFYTIIQEVTTAQTTVSISNGFITVYSVMFCVLVYLSHSKIIHSDR